MDVPVVSLPVRVLALLCAMSARASVGGVCRRVRSVAGGPVESRA